MRFDYRVVRKLLKRLARPEGVEPPTLGSEVCRIPPFPTTPTI